MINVPVAIITGASSGIGEATARLLGREGYRLVLAARRLDRLQNLAAEIQDAGGEVLPVETDLGRPEEIQALVQATLDRFGQIDVLVNNAGFGRLGWLENLDPHKDIASQLQVNLLAAILITREALPHMIARRTGHIIMMASMAGFVATPTYSVYAASKFGLRGFSDALRREVGVWNIHVSVLYPGGVKTEFSEHAGARRKTGVTTPASLRLSAEDVARVVLSVLHRPRRAVVLPGVMRLGIWVNAWFPGLVDRILEQRFTRPERGL